VDWGCRVSEITLTRRLLIAFVIAGVIYGAALGVGSLLYATGAIATGATHNDCENFREELAPLYGGDEEDVPQSAIKELAEECLAGHELTEEQAFREEYLFWPAWPAAICAVIFLAWPVWARMLHNQETADGFAEAEAASH
jgi:hypothetical protein